MLYYFILFLNFSLLFSFKCGHDLIKQTPKILNYSTTSNNSTRRLDSYHPISFFVDYTQMDSDTAVTPEYKGFIKESINSSLQVFSELLKVKRSGNLKIQNPGGCNSKITKFNESILTGIDYDIILIPIIDESLPEGVDAAATACFLDPTDYRPIMGYVSLGKNYAYGKTNAQEFLTMLLIHEISHILVFSDGLFEYFQYSGNVTTTQTINGVSRTLVQTTKVKKVATNHFGCNSLVGVELENQGGEGSAGSHWEARIMLGDYMISHDYPEIVISDITLALFEDSGWYDVNYYTGGLFRFGKGQGCGFLYSSCLSSRKSNFEWDFCDSVDQPKCTSNNLNRGFCYIREVDSDLPSYYQYFQNSRTGGWEPVDYCPVTMTYSSQNYYFSGSCIIGEESSTETSYPGFSISENSICIESSLIDSSATTPINERAICYKIKCNAENKTINVDIGETTIDCPTDGGEMEVNGYSGVIRCPPYNRVCTSKTYVGDSINAAINHIANQDFDNLNLDKDKDGYNDYNGDESENNKNTTKNKKNSVEMINLNIFYFILYFLFIIF
jgi:leishmanolysin